MKFDKNDKKLISYLYHHYREPLTKIAKACRMSRDQVEYRIKKYEEIGLIKKYITIFNYDLLGYNEFIIVWFNIKGNKEPIKLELEKMKNVLNLGDAISKYDLYANFMFKTKNEFQNYFNNFLQKHKNKIIDYSIFSVTFADLYPLKFFENLNQDKDYEIVEPQKQVKLSKKDMSILRCLEKNGRVRIIDIAKETGLSSELIIYKLKQLYKNKVILGTRIFLEMEKFGFYFGVLRLKLNNVNDNLKKKLRTFCKNHKNINSLAFGISNFNCLIQAFYQTEQELRQTLTDIKKFLDNEIIDSELILIENHGRVNTLPF